MTVPDTRDYEQAQAQLGSIRKMVKALQDAIKDDNQDAIEKAEEAIREDPLAVEVRSDWYIPGREPGEPSEYRILLCTGGPAVRLVGDLDRDLPLSIRLEYQDWFTPWQEYFLDADGEEVCLTYARQFYFGD